jgi:preprotein translocase subunit SecE
MAKSYNTPSGAAPGGSDPKKSRKPAPAAKAPEPANPRMAEAQRRAQMMAKRPQTPPKQFLEEAWVELKKTSWPTRDVLTKSTSVVLALVVSVAVFVALLDTVLRPITAGLFSGGGAH